MRGVKNFEIINFPKEITFLHQKFNEPALLQEPLSQPVLSVELFISDLIVQILRKFNKFLKKRSKRFPKSMNFSYKEQVVAT